MQNHACAFVLLICTLAVPAVAQRRVPNDLSGVRGINYEAAETWDSFGCNMILPLPSVTGLRQAASIEPGGCSTL